METDQEPAQGMSKGTGKVKVVVKTAVKEGKNKSNVKPIGCCW